MNIAKPAKNPVKMSNMGTRSVSLKIFNFNKIKLFRIFTISFYYLKRLLLNGLKLDMAISAPVDVDNAKNI